MIRQIVFGAASLGANQQQLLKEVGLSTEDLMQSDQKLEWQKGIEVWKVALSATGDPFLGLRIGQQTTTAMSGLVGHIMERSQTLFEAAQVLQNHLKLVNEMFLFRAQIESSYFILTIEPIDLWKLSSPETARQAVDLSFSSILHIARLLTAKAVFPLRVEFTANHPQNIAPYQAVFQTELKFNQAQNRLLFKAQDAMVPIISYNPEILGVLRKIASEKLQELDHCLSQSAAVEKWIAENWQKGLPTIQELAISMNVSIRTLQRRLKEEGASFQGILEKVHQQISLSLLENTGLTVNEIAFKLGYADPHAFRRAFKRWTGKNPLAVRKNRSGIS